MAISVPLAPFINKEFYVTGTYPNYEGSGNYHGGFDLSTGEHGTAPLYSIIDGTVSRIRINDGLSYGNAIEITASDGTRVLFGHMENAPTFNLGDVILQGQQVGIEGNTGNSTGYHVHVEMWDSNGNHINPATYMGIPNQNGGPYIYNGIPVPPTPTPSSFRKTKFKWVLYANKLRGKNNI